MKRVRPVLASLTALATLSLATAADWPQWRGPDRTDVSKETGLLQSWPEGGPKRVWLYEKAGLGYSGPAIADGKLFTLGTRDGGEILLALNANTGEELWTTKIGDILKNGWGDGPRGTPTVDGEHVYALSGVGNLVCAKTADGSLVWQKSMSDFGGRRPNWGYTESVLIDGDKVVCTPGGAKGAIIALNKTNGELIWQSKEFKEGAQYASIMVAELHGVRQYIQLTQKALVGVDADSGKVLWRTSWPGRTAVIPTPVVSQGHVYITSGYGVGNKLVKIDAGFKPVDVYENKSMKNHHGGVVLVDGYLYGYSDGPGWTCQDFLTGKVQWTERRALGKGAITYADGRLYLLDERKGTVALIEASPKAYKEHGRFTLDPQSPNRSSRGKVWTHPVVSNGKLYLRDQEYIYCYDVKANGSTAVESE